MNYLTPHQLKALEMEGHLALTANAGSGKTFVLARKYLAAAMKTGVDLSNIAAITFTEKAASELYKKISELIDEHIILSSSVNERKKLENIRRQLVSANISTIHSFCIDILREFPVEAQIDARFTPIDENLSTELVEMSVDEMVQQSFVDEESVEDLKYLIRIFSSKVRFESEIINLIKQKKNVLQIKERIYNQNEEEIAKFFYQSFVEIFLLIWDRIKDSFLNNLRTINSVVLQNDSSNQTAIELKQQLNLVGSQREVEKILELIKIIKDKAFTKQLSLRKQGYAKSEIMQEFSNEISITEEMINHLSKFELEENHNLLEMELAKFGKTLLSFFNRASDIYESKKKSDGYVDFEDILLHTKTLLQNQNVKKALSEKFKFIMVDEFQDTNEIQYQIFLPILDYLKGGNLFIVGDEKQSIYKFRDAEIEIFNLTRNEIKDKSGEENLKVLPDSFRMAPAICVFCNHLFKNLFSNHDEYFGEVPNSELVCAREEVTPGSVEFLIASDEENKQEEAELVALKILEMCNNDKVNWKDISILVRKRKSFASLERSFIKYGIPFTIIGGRGFYQRQTISDIFNYLSFLADENNNAALVGILRSPFFTFSDAELFEISLLNGKNFFNKLKNYSATNLTAEKVYKLLHDNTKLSGSVDLPILFKKILADNDYITIISKRKDGVQELANLDKLISIARNFSNKGFRNLYDFINLLSDSISGLEDEPQASVSGSLNAVQMMTIHQAKGLEFPIVILYQCSEGSLSSATKSKQVQVSKKFGLLTKLPINQNYLDDYKAAPAISAYDFIEEKKSFAELKRLLYVGVTRAKDILIISSTLAEEKSLRKDSFISLLGAGLDSDFSKNEIVLQEDLNFLIKQDQVYSTKKENIKLVVPIITEIAASENMVKETVLSEADLKFNLENLSSLERGEIISASKVSIYNQCPLKYLLTYEYGFGKLTSKILTNTSSSSKGKNNQKYDEDILYISDETDNDNQPVFNSGIKSDLRGRIIHSILEKEIYVENINDYFNNYSEGEMQIHDLNEEDKKSLKHDLMKFYESNFYKKLQSFTDYKNEYEIYVQESDYYLYGIIDKIIFDSKRLIIIDYKTDDIDLKDIEERAKNYSMQLKFYLYIASRLFKGFEKLEGNLVFLKFPDNYVTLSYSLSQIQNIKMEITEIIEGIREKNINKNYKHCAFCSYSDSLNRCVID
jgi:ATP-dependent helicase/nuclease subunit A